ncbi:hypothetical protein HMPREF0059_01313 [Actinomyces viscosus C505]|uniref:Uncharacterized protein n=1 Tax=Actinomyces viscosus C505 TaxID=562973 RepID=F2UWX3_ACTVI|nr:hypothetical protein HMPREF0059_01313 [Actinomyces viscosus C505]
MKCPAVFLTGTDTAGISLYGREIRAVPVQVESRRLEDRVLTLCGEVIMGTCKNLLHTFIPSPQSRPNQSAASDRSPLLGQSD